jgi:hypothetical protein
MGRPHNRTDVNIFRELTKRKYFTENNINSQKAVFKCIENIHKSEIIVKGFNINRQRELRNINASRYGFREYEDIKFEFIQDVFDNNTKILLLPSKIYDMEESFDIPRTNDSTILAYTQLLSDSMERIKVRAEYILSDTEEISGIELYAKKNILMAHKIFNETILLLQKAKLKNDRREIFIAYIQNVYIIKLINYLQDLFGAFYSDRRFSKKTLRNELYEVINLKTFLDLNECKQQCMDGSVLGNGGVLQWNGPINRLVTLFYDLKHDTMPNQKPLLDAEVDDIKFILTNFFTDRNGNFIKGITIDTYMKEYRDEKRAQGKSRIDINKYKN